MTFSHKIASLGMYSNGLPIIKPQSQPKNQFSKGPFFPSLSVNGKDPCPWAMNDGRRVGPVKTRTVCQITKGYPPVTHY